MSKPQNKHRKKRHVSFHSQWKGTSYSLVNNNRRIFMFLFVCDVYLRSLDVLHFHWGLETSIMLQTEVSSPLENGALSFQ